MAKFSFESMPNFQVLKQEEILQIHEKALELLETTGVKFEHPEVLQMLAPKGCSVDEKKMILRIPRDLVVKSIESTPEHFLLFNREGSVALRLGEGHSYYAPGPGSPNILDPSVKRRLGTAEDLKTALKIMESSPGFQISSGSIVPQDVPSKIADIFILYQQIINSQKPILAEAWEEASVKRIGRLLEAVCGSRDLVKEKPFVLLAACPAPPLRWEKRVIDNVLDCMELGIPVFLSPSPVMGISSPVTIAGSVLTHTVEALSCLAFIQLLHPGHKVLYGGIPETIDMRSLYCSASSVEACLSTAAYSCMAHYYGIPALAFLAQSDAKENDYQAGFETAMDLIVSTMAGIDVVFGGGTLDSYLCTSNEKLAMDGQFFQYGQRLQKGILVEEDTIAQEEIADIGYGEDGMFLEMEHTTEWYQQEQCMLNHIVDKASYEQVCSKNKPIGQRAEKFIQECGSSPAPPEMEKRLKEAFMDISREIGIDSVNL